MKGINITNDSYNTKINNIHNSNYGYNIYKDDHDLLEYERFFKTKNNLFVHDNIKR